MPALPNSKKPHLPLMKNRNIVGASVLFAVPILHASAPSHPSDGEGGPVVWCGVGALGVLAEGETNCAAGCLGDGQCGGPAIMGDGDRSSGGTGLADTGGEVEVS